MLNRKVPSLPILTEIEETLSRVGPLLPRRHHVMKWRPPRLHEIVRMIGVSPHHMIIVRKLEGGLCAIFYLFDLKRERIEEIGTINVGHSKELEDFFYIHEKESIRFCFYERLFVKTPVLHLVGSIYWKKKRVEVRKAKECKDVKEWLLIERRNRIGEKFFKFFALVDGKGKRIAILFPPPKMFLSLKPLFIKGKILFIHGFVAKTKEEVRSLVHDRIVFLLPLRELGRKGIYLEKIRNIQIPNRSGFVIKSLDSWWAGWLGGVDFLPPDNLAYCRVGADGGSGEPIGVAEIWIESPQKKRLVDVIVWYIGPWAHRYIFYIDEKGNVEEKFDPLHEVHADCEVGFFTDGKKLAYFRPDGIWIAEIPKDTNNGGLHFSPGRQRMKKSGR